jgi:hypothetical protein
MVQISRTNHATWIFFGADDDGEWCGSDDFPRKMELIIPQWNEMAVEVHDPCENVLGSRGGGVRMSIFRACSGCCLSRESLHQDDSTGS